MTSQTPDMQAVLERLEKLERQFAALDEIVGGIIDAHMDQIGRKVDQAAAKNNTVQAEEFILRDSQGRLGACLCFLESGPALVLYDANRTGGATLCLQKEAAALHLSSPTCTEKAILRATSDGPALSLSDKEGFTVLMGSLHMLARQALEVRGVAKSQQFPQAIVVMQGDKSIWSAPPPPNRQSLFSRLFHWH